MWFRSSPFSFYIIVRFSPPKLHIFLQSTNYFHLLFINIGIFEAKTIFHSFAFPKLLYCYIVTLESQKSFLETVNCYLPRL